MELLLNSKNIKAELKSRKISQVFIARMLKLHPVCVNEVITGKRHNPRIQAAIALAIGKPVDEIFPNNKNNTSVPADKAMPVAG